jgi:hypothetical protein
MGERKDGMQNVGKKERERASGKELARNNEWERSWRERIGGKQLPEIIQREIIRDIGGSSLFVHTCLHISVLYIIG